MKKKNVFVVLVSSSFDGESKTDVFVFADRVGAVVCKRRLVAEFKENNASELEGISPDNMWDDEDSFGCYIDGYHAEFSFEVNIMEKELL